MIFTTPNNLKPKINFISQDEHLSQLFYKLLKIIENNHTNTFFIKKNNSNKSILTISMTDNYKMDIDFKVSGYETTIVNILIHDEWFSNL